MDERHLLAARFKDTGISGIQSIPRGGKERLGEQLPLVAKNAHHAPIFRFGIPRDADNDAASAFECVCGALSNNGLAESTVRANFESAREREVL